MWLEVKTNKLNIMGLRTEPRHTPERTLSQDEGYPLPPISYASPVKCCHTNTEFVQLLQQKLMINFIDGPGPIQEDRVNPGRVSFVKCFLTIIVLSTLGPISSTHRIQWRIWVINLAISLMIKLLNLEREFVQLGLVMYHLQVCPLIIPYQFLNSDFKPTEVGEIIRKSPNESCTLDPLPTWLLKENLAVLYRPSLRRLFLLLWKMRWSHPYWKSEI